ncbi:MAG TPA: endo-1,4-beta-xylanase [Polyangiaceae bacterium]|nr:endo-1,4-beta-xylanase [Polyangiaceae bacterium]
MRTTALHFCIFGTILAAAACSAAEGGPIIGTGGSVAPGGGTGAGGASGASTVATGGVTPTGGTRSTGGANTGGVVSTGGGGTTSTQPVAGGGSTAVSGGATSVSGGATSVSGGASTTGGRPGGGAPGSGGASSGGRPNTGGASSAGASSGGTTSSTGGMTATGGGTSQPPPGKKFVGNITTGRTNMDSGGKTFSKYWDQVTPENAGKWGEVQSSATASPNWSTLDQIYDYTQKNNIIFKQHTFIWGAQQPSGNITEANVKKWMKDFCTRYPNTKLIDVVNEPPPHTRPGYRNSIGGGDDSTWQWITNAFKWAREACPNAILILNDYNNIEWDNDNAHFISIVQKIKEGGAPIDAVGCQAHDLDVNDKAMDLSKVKTLVENLHNKTQLPLYITELDLTNTDDQTQLQWYKQFFPYFYGLDYVHGITIWGWIYGQTWSLSPNSGLVRNGSFRPAMTWLMGELGRPTN